MRLKAGEPGSEKLRAILLDGKVVPMPFEANEEEGWVKSWMPNLPDGRAENGENLVEDDEAKMAGFDLVERCGNVKIVFWNTSPVADKETTEG